MQSRVRCHDWPGLSCSTLMQIVALDDLRKFQMSVPAIGPKLKIEGLA